MGFFDSILKGVGAIAPFFGPAGALVGAGAGAVGGILEGNKAQGQANQFAGMTKEQLQYLKAQQGKLDPVLQSAIDQALASKVYDYGDNDPYSQDYQDASYSAYGEDSMRAANSGIESLVNNYARNGIIGGTGINQGISRITSDATTDLARYRMSLRERGALAKQEQVRQESDARFQRASSLIPVLQQTQGQLMGGIGGQQTMAQQRADTANAGVGTAIGTIAANAGGIFGGKDAGNNRTGTNQQGTSPFSLPAGTPPWNPNGTPLTAPLTTAPIQFGGGAKYYLGRRVN